MDLHNAHINETGESHTPLQAHHVDTEPDKQNIFLSLPFFALIAGIVLLALQAASLLLFKDDHVHIFPSLLKAYESHFKQVTYDYGLTRPLGFLYFYGIYTLSLVSMSAAHLVVYAAHALAAFIMFKLFSKVFTALESGLLALTFLFFPFFTEQYGWFGAGNATLALLILMVQIWIIPTTKINHIIQLVLIALLQFIGVLLYESLFFTFIPLIVAMAVQERKLFSVRNVITFIILALPSAIYYILKTFVYPPHYAGFAREAALSPALFSTAITNVGSYLKSLQFLFLAAGPQQVFWMDNFWNGFSLLTGNLLYFGLFLAVICLLGYASYKIYTEPQIKNDKATFLSTPGFWLLLSLFTLLPALLLAQPAFPFRVIALPLFSIIIALYLYIRKVNMTAGLLYLAILLAFFIPSTLQILSLMKQVALDDERHFIQVVEGVIKASPDQEEKVAVFIKDPPTSTRTIFAFGEYLSSCASSDWCLQAAVNRRTGKIQQVYVREQKKTELPVISFSYNPETRDLVLSDE